MRRWKSDITNVDVEGTAVEGCTSHNGRRYAMSARRRPKGRSPPEPPRASRRFTGTPAPPAGSRCGMLPASAGEDRPFGFHGWPPSFPSSRALRLHAGESARPYFFARGAPGVVVKFRRRNEGRGREGGSAGNLVPARRPALLNDDSASSFPIRRIHFSMGGAPREACRKRTSRTMSVG